jgi:hypothetical protein
VHHFSVAGDVEESNPLFDSQHQAAEKPFSVVMEHTSIASETHPNIARLTYSLA